MTSNPSIRKSKILLSRIQIQNKQKRYKINRMSASIFCETLLRNLRMDDAALSVDFIGGREMQRINHRFRQRDYPTDVLSFAYDETYVEGIRFLGEIVISPEVAVLHAFEYRIHPDKEIKNLLVHGILHLLGYDHEIDEGEMNKIQKKLVRRVFFRKATPVLIA